MSEIVEMLIYLSKVLKTEVFQAASKRSFVENFLKLKNSFHLLRRRFFK